MPKSKKNRFANIIVIICVAMDIIITFAVLYEYHRLNTAIPNGVLGVLAGMYSSELLICALRQIFGSNVVSQAKKPKQEEEMYP